MSYAHQVSRRTTSLRRASEKLWFYCSSQRDQFTFCCLCYDYFGQSSVCNDILVPPAYQHYQLSLVRVSEERSEYNETSPTLDLSSLYGVNESESDLVRAKDGRGMLSPDCFYENRIMYLSPAVSALLILWNRNHNVR